MTIRELEIHLRDHLRAALPDTIQVDLLGGDIRKYVPQKPDVILLQWGGSGYSSPRPTQDRRVRFTIYVGSKHLRKDGQGGALDLIDELRGVLTNHRFDDLGEGDAKLYPETEDPLLFDEKTGIYWYFTRYAARTTWTV